MRAPVEYSFGRGSSTHFNSEHEQQEPLSALIRKPLQMRTPDQYREFAAECFRLAAEAKTEEQQKILEEMARAWREVAEEVETKPDAR